jgi:mannose-6-phosphate isomerase-like protein (cupin superfamily)
VVQSNAPRPRVLGPDDGDALWFLGSLVTVKVAGADTSGRLTVVDFLNPPGFAPPLHRHRVEDEMFAIREGEATFFCEGERFAAGPGDFVVLPAGLAHSFLVGPDAPLRYLQITTPGGFEAFAAAVGEPATERRLPEPGPFAPAALAHAADLHGVDILGPPPTA